MKIKECFLLKEREKVPIIAVYKVKFKQTFIMIK